MTVITIKAQTHSRFQKGPEITAADWSVVQWTFELSADKTCDVKEYFPTAVIHFIR